MKNKEAITYVNGELYKFQDPKTGEDKKRINCFFKVPEGLAPGMYQFTLFVQDEERVKYPKEGALAYFSGKLVEYVKKGMAKKPSQSFDPDFDRL